MNKHIARIPSVKGIRAFVPWHEGILLKNKGDRNLLHLMIVLYDLKLKDLTYINTFHPNKNNIYRVRAKIINYIYCIFNNQRK